MFKELFTENVGQMWSEIDDATFKNKKGQKVLGKFIDDNFIDTEKYVPDWTPEDYFEKFTDSDVKALHKALKKARVI